MIETGIEDKSWHHFDKNIQGTSHAKGLEENIPGGEIMDADSTKQERHCCIQET